LIIIITTLVLLLIGFVFYINIRHNRELELLNRRLIAESEKQHKNIKHIRKYIEQINPKITVLDKEF
jgi:sensor domain CHASE-containing protein